MDESFVRYMYWEISSPAKDLQLEVDLLFKIIHVPLPLKKKIIHVLKDSQAKFKIVVKPKADISLHPEVNLTHNNILNANGVCCPI